MTKNLFIKIAAKQNKTFVSAWEFSRLCMYNVCMAYIDSFGITIQYRVPSHSYRNLFINKQDYMQIQNISGSFLISTKTTVF